MTSDLPLLLIVDDDETFAQRLGRAFTDRGYDVMVAGDFASAVALAERQPPEFAVVDLRMPGRSGLELVARLTALDPATATVVLTGYGSIATALEAVRLGAVHYLTKPADADEIENALLRRSGAATQTSTPIAVPSLARAEWEHIARVLADCEGNISEAARRLKIHRRSLQRKLQKPPTGE